MGCGQSLSSSAHLPASVCARFWFVMFPDMLFCFCHPECKCCPTLCPVAHLHLFTLLHITSIYINKPPVLSHQQPVSQLTRSCRLYFVATRFPAFLAARLSLCTHDMRSLFAAVGVIRRGPSARLRGSSSVCRQFRLLTGVCFLAAPAHFVTLLPPFKTDCFECWV